MPTKRLQTAQRAAVETGKELVKFFHTGQNSGSLKGDLTLVTEADRAADQMIQKFINEEYPGDGILSEENSTIFPETDHAWVVDPLDGTVNFSHNLLYWGVSIAHLENGMPQDGAVYFPLLDELYTASLGKGAALNGSPLTLVDEIEDLFPVFVHCSRMHQRYEIRTRYTKRSLGAAAYHICLVAKSAAALALESTPRIWDIAAGWLIVQEAGGSIQTLTGENPFPAQPGEDYAKKPFPILAAGNTAILEEALQGIILKK